MFKTVALIFVTTFGSSGPPAKVEHYGTFYGETAVDALLGCRTLGKRQLPIKPMEYSKDKIFTRSFICVVQGEN